MGDETVTLNRRNTSVHSAESEHAEGLPDNTVNGGETNQHVEENLQVKNIVSGETERDRRDSSHVAGYRDQQHQDQLLPKNPSDDTASQSFFGVIAGKSRALRDNFSIVVPPVKRSLNYQLLDAEPTVRRVLNEFPDFSGVKFLVEYNKGGHAIVGFTLPSPLLSMCSWVFFNDMVSTRHSQYPLLTIQPYPGTIFFVLVSPSHHLFHSRTMLHPWRRHSNH